MEHISRLEAGLQPIGGGGIESQRTIGNVPGNPCRRDTLRRDNLTPKSLASTPSPEPLRQPVQAQEHEQPDQQTQKTNPTNHERELTSPIEGKQSLEPQREQSQLSPEHTEQSAQNTNAIGPGRELTSQTAWRQWLEQNIKGFSGDLDNAAMLMAAFTEGKSYILDKITSGEVERLEGLHTFEDLESLKRPNTFILDDDTIIPSQFASVNGGNDIVATKTFLERVSNYDMQAITTITRKDGAVVFKGKIPDLFRTAALEEAYSAAFNQLHKEVTGIDPRSTTVPEYDAHEVEFRPLIWQYIYAIESKMPPETIQFFKDRLDAAYDVRTQRAKQQK